MSDAPDPRRDALAAELASLRHRAESPEGMLAAEEFTAIVGTIVGNLERNAYRGFPGLATEARSIAAAAISRAGGSVEVGGARRVVNASGDGFRSELR